MITRFDHVVIGVQDLEDAIATFRSLGFEVFEGGRHPALGTRNAIIRFGLDYIELLAVEDENISRKSGRFGSELVDFLEQSSGLLGFVLASDNLDDEAGTLRLSNIEFKGPFGMDRRRPDGTTMAWKLVIPGTSPWRKPWPFLIEWETADEKRLRWEQKGNHSNGCTSVLGIDLMVGDLADSRLFYEKGLSLNPILIKDDDKTNPSAVHYKIGNFRLSLKLPLNKQERFEFETLGPGPSRLILDSKKLNNSFRLNKEKSGLNIFEFDQTLAQGAKIVKVG